MLNEEIRRLPAVRFEAITREICQPLFDSTPITYFSFLEIHENKIYSLTTAATALSVILSKGLHEYSVVNNNADTMPTGLFLWEAADLCPLAKESLDIFADNNISNGVSLCSTSNNRALSFEFAAPTKKRSVFDFYLNHKDVLVNFCNYFVNEIRKNQIDYHCSPIQVNHYKNRSNFVRYEIGGHEGLIDKVLKSSIDYRDISTFAIDGGNKVFTNREAQCIFLLVKGNTATEIAKIMRLSKRTVENYLEYAKNRVGASNRIELTTIFLKNNPSLLKLI